MLRNLAVRRDRACLVGKKTELVIDGVQRSANGWATYTFLAAQQRRTSVAHHLHSGEQVARAARRHTPVLLLIREPVACVLAIVGAWPYVSVSQALRAYVRYYNRTAPVADHCVIGFFDEVTASPRSVIERLNARYGTSFDLVQPTQESATRLYDPHDPARASRRVRAEAAATQLDDPSNRVLLRTAQGVWGAFQQYRE